MNEANVLKFFKCFHFFLWRNDQLTPTPLLQQNAQLVYPVVLSSVYHQNQSPQPKSFQGQGDGERVARKREFALNRLEIPKGGVAINGVQSPCQFLPAVPLQGKVILPTTGAWEVHCTLAIFIH